MSLYCEQTLAFERCNAKFTVNWDAIEDGELIMLSDNVSSVRDEFNDVNKLCFEFIEKCPQNSPDKDDCFSILNNSMTDTQEKKTVYESMIIKEMQKRELTCNKIQDCKNEIKLADFQGYGSGLDFYSFQSRFLNKYRRYPSRDMVDILKNTYLKGEAYNTLKELTKLDIWNCLKDEFGNPCRMLRGKLAEILSVGPFHKIKGLTEKNKAVLKTINLLTDIFKLAEEHNLHLELYSKNEKVLNQMLKQLPRLWLHDWQALKKTSKTDNERKMLGAPARKEDQLNWELFKHLLLKIVIAWRNGKYAITQPTTETFKFRLKKKSNWLKANNLSLNASKTELITFSHPNKKNNYDFKIKIDGKKLIPQNVLEIWGF